MTRAFIALGSNLGDRLESLQAATDALATTELVTVRRSSRIYETEPVGGPEGQDAYLNAVLEIDTTLPPMDLLDRCLAIEHGLGRVRGERWGPRTIDLDILTFGEDVIDEPDLQVPHPRMHQRMFVLAPLLELEADPLLPGGRKVATMPLSVADPFGVRPVFPPLAVHA